jgi:hypothetical protein
MMRYLIGALLLLAIALIPWVPAVAVIITRGN